MQKKKFTELAGPIPSELKTVSEQLSKVDFWVCASFADTVNRYCEITMKTDDISPLHAMAMWHLVCAGGTSTPTRLADKMFRSKHSVTKIVDNLEKEGLIIRDFSSRDRRVTQIRITNAGLNYIKANQDVANIQAKHVMDCLDKEQTKTLVDLMVILQKRMTDILEKI
jgi:MarR family transcriptional regulator, organic hydroperoxide resistance regulator